MPKPTIGRVVHYTAHDEVTYAAIVVQLYDDDVVGLTVFYIDAVQSGIRATHSDVVTDKGTWRWPPMVRA